MGSSTVGRLWEREVLSRLLEIGMRGVQPLRREILSGVKGRVLEIGIGTGVSLAHYGPEVTELVAIEPAVELAGIARKRLEHWSAERGAVAEIHEVSATRPLPVDAESFDAVVVLFVMCSVERVDEFLEQTRRALKPGGTLHLAEHVAATQDPTPHPIRAKTQRMIRPAWQLALGGCDPHKEIDQALIRHGFDISGLSRRELELPWVVRSGLVGTATLRG